MSELNPYARFLDGRPPDAILAETGARLASLLAAIGPEKALVPPAPGKWSPVEIVCHLADCELVFAFRLRQTLAEDAPVIQPFDQDKWAATYPGVSAEQALQVFKAVRGWNLRLIVSALQAAAARPDLTRAATATLPRAEPVDDGLIPAFTRAGTMRLT